MLKRSLSLLLALVIAAAVFAALPASAAEATEDVGVGAPNIQADTYEGNIISGDIPTEATQAPGDEPHTEEATEPEIIEDYPVITYMENTENGVLIRWDAYDGADFYRIYYKNENGGWVRLASKYLREYVDTSAVDGEERVYTVRALNENEDFVSDFNRVGWAQKYYAPPVIDAIETLYKTEDGRSAFDGVRLTWRAVDGVMYRVYRRNGSSSWERLAQVGPGMSEYTDPTALPGVSYRYTLRMIDEDENFISDYLYGRTVIYTEAPAIKSIQNTDRGAEITWNTVEGADFYRVYYKNENGGWTRLASKYKPEYTDTSVKGGETRVYTLRALDEDENFVSDFNRDGWSNTYVEAPVITSLESVGNGVEIRWDKCAGAEMYRVYYYGSRGWTAMANVTDNAYVDEDVASGYTYTYTVRCISPDLSRFTSDYNPGKKVRYVATPQITSFENNDSGVKIKWTKSSGADFYRVYYKVSGGWSRLTSTYSTEYVDTSVKNGETRVYTVRCLDDDEDFVSDYNREGWSNTYFEAPAITSVKVSGGRNVVSWEAPDGVAAYRLYRKSPGGSWSRLFDSITDSSYTDVTSEQGMIYAYTLRCLDSDGNLISGYIDRARFYKDGAPLNGNYYENGTYGFKDGYIMTGLNRVSGKLRYYNSDGRMYRDTVVGSSSEGYYYTDADGVCCESEEMRLAAEFIAKYCKGNTLKEKMKYGFLYMAKNYPYERVYNDTPSDESDVSPFAVELFKLHKGTCYRYAAAYACVAKIAGYRSRFCFGQSGALVHGWTEVYVNGSWLICDVDAQLPGYGYADYAPYMMKEHMWPLAKYWHSELVIKNGKAVWEKKINY